ncbi:MAG: hypothetical protein SF182_14880 [Deltaproteobacteria bacterium]|nr:hypothetical protein [Deltaproteobacteria bacterium]
MNGVLRRSLAGASLATLLLGSVAAAPAHDMSTLTQRELVRLQGYRAPAPRGVEVEREIKLFVLNESIPFAANEWRVFALQQGKEAAPTPGEVSQVILQGDRALLRRVVTAHADQRITILAERHPGGGDLFLLSVDLCPEK